jgi:glycerophosphoryl diester phosphodiesterase
MIGHIHEPTDAPLVIAHRGASAFAPENTLSAFRLAEVHGADGIELDAKLTRDSAVIILHDMRLERTTSGTGDVRDWPLEDIRRLDAGGYFHPRFQGEQVPTLEEVLDALQTGMLINIELTNYGSVFDELPELVFRIIAERGVEERVLVSSFNPVAIIKIRRLSEAIRTALLVRTTTPGVVVRLMQQILRPDYFHPEYGILNNRVLAKEHAAGRKVMAWTVNGRDEIRRLIASGIDGIITDYPDLARTTIGRRKGVATW